jgi:hypothetical protein
VRRRAKRQLPIAGDAPAASKAIERAQDPRAVLLAPRPLAERLGEKARLCYGRAMTSVALRP